MRIHLCSDLHNEFYKGHPPDLEVVGADMLILAGDISVGPAGIKWAAEQIKHLGIKHCIMINGNHEYYSGVDYHSLIEMMRSETAEAGIHFLENEQIIIDGIRFLGCTLWSDFCAMGEEYQQEAMGFCQHNIADYGRIRMHGARILPHHTYRLHQESVNWLESRLLEHFEGPTVVVTHHGPNSGCQDIQKYGPPEYISTAFWSDLEWMMLMYKPEVWCYGHTHSNMRFTVEGVRVISNQRGYPSEKVSGYDQHLLVEVQP